MTTFDLRQIFHPSDFSESSETAFAHALKLAVAAQSKLTIYHTDPDHLGAVWRSFPQVRSALEKWNVLPPNSSKEDVVGLGVGIEKVSAPHRDAVSSILKYLQKHPHDLIVLTTYQHEGIDRWMKKAVAEPIARQSGEITLFLPHQSPGFISAGTGQVSLKNVLIPIDQRPHPQLAIEIASSLAHLLGCVGVNFHLLHVGNEKTAPQVKLPFGDSGAWTPILGQGNVIDQILKTAEEIAADLIVMATQGHEGFLDALRGSTTERIVRASSCPVLAVPSSHLLRNNLQEAFIFQPEA